MEYKNNQNAYYNLTNENDEISNTITQSLEDIINTDDIINYISSTLYFIIHTNKTMKKKQPRSKNEPLYSKKIPVLSLNKFLIRIIKYTECENNTLIVAFLYIMKLIQKEKFVLEINNVYRLLLGAVVLAKKVLEDIKLDNSYYCGIGGISNSELNSIEYSLFVRIDFNVNLKKEDVNKIYEQIFKTLPKPRLNEIFQKINVNVNINIQSVGDNKININNKVEDIKNKESQIDKKTENNKDKCKSNDNNSRNINVINNG